MGRTKVPFPITKGELVQTLSISLNDLGHHDIRAADYVDIQESYEEEMRKQPSRVSYLESVKAEMEQILAIEEDRLAAWVALRRQTLAEKLRSESPTKKSPTIADLDAALDADLDALAQKQHIHFLRTQVKKMAGILAAMHHKKAMLEQLAQTERRGLSEYQRGVRLSEDEAQRQYEDARNRFLTATSSKETQ